MRKISGQLLSSNPVSLDRAAKLITNFASADNGSSATISLYLQRTADAFDDLLRFHNKRSKHADAGDGPRRKKVRTSESDDLGEKTAEGLKIRGERGNEPVNGPNPNEDEVNASEKEQGKAEKKKKKKKKKKVKNDADEGLDA